MASMQSTCQCSQCHMVLEDSKLESHISAHHLDYFPLECAWCKEDSQKHFSATKEDMKDHCSKNHNGKNSRYSAFEDEDKEVELKKLAMECRHLSVPQIPSNESQSALHYVRNVLGAATSTGNAQVKPDDDDDDVIIIEDDSKNMEMPNITLEDNLPEPSTQEIVSLIPLGTSTKPTAIAVTPTTNFEDNLPNAEILTMEPIKNVSSVPIGLRLQAALSSYVPIDVDVNEDQPNSVALQTFRMASAFCNKRSHLGDSSENSVGSPKKRMSLQQEPTGHAVDVSTHPDRCSRMNRIYNLYGSIYNFDGEQNDRTTTKENETNEIHEIAQLIIKEIKSENEASGEPKARKSQSSDLISNIAKMNKDTAVDILKFFNYCQLAKNSLVSKRFRDLIQIQRNKLALLYVNSLVMGRRDNSGPASIKIFNKKLSPETYNEWVTRNNYSKLVTFKRQIAGDSQVFKLSANGDFKDPNFNKRSVFFARVEELNHENWPLFEHFIRLFTDPFIYIRTLRLIHQNDVFNLLAAIIDRNNRGRLQCENLDFNFAGIAQKFLHWIKNNVCCINFRIAAPSSSVYRDKQLLDFFATGSHCTSEIVVTDSHISKAVIIDFVQKFLCLENYDENQLVKSIRGNISNRSVNGVKRNYAKFMVTKERHEDNDASEQVFEFVNNDIGKKLQLTFTIDLRSCMADTDALTLRYRTSGFLLKIENL